MDKQILSEIISDAEAISMPLWKTCLDLMCKSGIEHGKTYPAEFFEKNLRQSRDSMAFGLDISRIRRGLEHHGYYLSGRGQDGNEFIVLPPENNRTVMDGYQRRAIDALRRGVILGTNTRLDLLTDEDRRRHESTLERIATRAALVSRRLPKAERKMLTTTK